jgi:hypothetical protein
MPQLSSSGSQLSTLLRLLEPSMMLITHAMPKNLLVDEVVRIGLGSLSAVSDTHDETKKEVEGGAHG